MDEYVFVIHMRRPEILFMLRVFSPLLSHEFGINAMDNETIVVLAYYVK